MGRADLKTDRTEGTLRSVHSTSRAASGRRPRWTTRSTARSRSSAESSVPNTSSADCDRVALEAPARLSFARWPISTSSTSTHARSTPGRSRIRVRRRDDSDLPDLDVRAGGRRRTQGLRLRARRQPHADGARGMPRVTRVGRHGHAFSSGLGATTTLMHLVDPGQRVVCVNDVYGGTYRMFSRVYEGKGYRVHLRPSERDRTTDLGEPSRPTTSRSSGSRRRPTRSSTSSTSARLPTPRTTSARSWSSTTRSPRRTSTTPRSRG